MGMKNTKERFTSLKKKGYCNNIMAKKKKKNSTLNVNKNFDSVSNSKTWSTCNDQVKA